MDVGFFPMAGKRLLLDDQDSDEDALVKTILKAVKLLKASW